MALILCESTIGGKYLWNGKTINTNPAGQRRKAPKAFDDYYISSFERDYERSAWECPKVCVNL